MLMKKNIPNMILLNLIRNVPSLVVCLVILVVCIMILGKVGSPASAQAQSGDIFSILSSELSSHPEFKDVIADNPRITYMSAQFLENAKQGNVAYFADAILPSGQP